MRSFPIMPSTVQPLHAGFRVVPPISAGGVCSPGDLHVVPFEFDLVVFRHGPNAG